MSSIQVGCDSGMNLKTEEEYVVERRLSAFVQASFYDEVVECLISDSAAWVRFPAGAKVISFFSPVTHNIIMLSKLVLYLVVF